MRPRLITTPISTEQTTDDDVKIFDEMAVRRALRRACKDSTLSAVASEAGVSEGLLASVIDGDRAPPVSVCKVVGYAPVLRYRREGER